MRRPRSQRYLLPAAGALALAVGWGLAWRSPPAVPGPPAPSPPAAVDAGPLVPGETRRGRLAPGQAHAYTVELAAGELLHAVVAQQGIDLVATLLDPARRPLLVVDSPTGPEGDEEVVAVAATAGTYRLVLHPWLAFTAGAYEARLAARRPATAEDAARAAAASALSAAEVLRRRGGASLAAAVPRYRDAAGRFAALGDASGRFLSLYRLGQAQAAAGDLAAAVATYDDALRRARRDGRGAEEVLLLNALGALHRRRGEMARAAGAYERARALARAGGFDRGEATALNNLGVLADLLGDSHRAVELYERALPVWRRTGDGESLARTLHDLGESYSLVGRQEEAADFLRRALAMRRRGGDRAGEAASLTALGWTRDLAGAAPEALAAYSEALRLYRALGDAAGTAGVLDRRGSAQLRLGRLQLAEEDYLAALAIVRRRGDRLGEAHTLTNLGWLHLGRDRAHQARSAFARALPRFRRVGDRNGEAHALVGSAQAEMERGRLRDARRHLEEALTLVRELHGALERPALSRSFLATRHDYYSRFVELLMELDARQPAAGHAAHAFAVAEEARARDLLANLAAGEAPLELAAAERRLGERLNAAEARRRRAAAGDEDAAAALAAAEREVRDLLRERDRLQARRRGAGALARRPLALAEVQRLLVADTRLLAYSLGEEASTLWVVGPDSFASHRLLPRRQLEESARRLHGLLARSHQRGLRQQARLAAAAAGRQLLAPAAGDLAGVKRLLVVPDGALHYLPFAALPEPGAGTPAAGGAAGGDDRGHRPLMADREIVQLPSASVLATLRRRAARPAPAAITAAVMADPVFQAGDPRVSAVANGAPADLAADTVPAALTRSAGDLGIDRFERLPFSRREAEALLALAPPPRGFGALGFAASRDTVLGGGLARYRIVHFATHGLVHPRHPELSGLVLSLVGPDGRPRDGFLRAHEIAGLELAADLVVLSACRTALGPEIRGEGLVGLTGSFLAAGAGGVVVSLWNVHDEATAELMGRFYRRLLAGGLAPAAALRAAQLSLAAEPAWQAPYYWAGFVYQGGTE